MEDGERGFDLEEHELQFLQGLVPAAQNDDLRTVYASVHALVASGRILRTQLCTTGERRFRWHVVLFTSAGRSIFEEGRPLSRSVATGVALLGRRASGLVAFNEDIRLADDLRDRKLGRAIYENEDELYRRWCVDEIHIDHAVDDGLVVWVKKFGFLPTDCDFVERVYRRWVARKPEPRPPSPCPVSDYPDEFLKGLGHLSLYKPLR